MKEWILRLIIALAVLLLFIPEVQMKFHLVSETPLVGVVDDVSRPTLTRGTWFDGSFQTVFTEWFEHRFGFRSYLIKTDNEINWRLFDSVSAKTHTRLVRGLGSYLFEYAYIDEYVRRPFISDEILHTRAEQLARAYRLLKNQGIAFLFVISPSKASIYPEYIPPAYRLDENIEQRRAYDRFLLLLDELSVPYVDGHAILAEVKAQGIYPVFAKGGTHWNYYSACVVVDGIIKELEVQNYTIYRHTQCDPPMVDTTPIGTDKDLEELLNLWDASSFQSLAPHPSLVVKKPRDDHEPRILFVGDSFSHTLRRIMNGRTTNHSELLYYFERRMVYDDGVESSRTDDVRDVERNFGNTDAVIVEINESSIEEIGFGFLEYLADALPNGLEH